jgi:hypothetical protein
LAAFESGDIIIFSVDTFNHNTRLVLLDSSGLRQSELKLFDDDYAKQLDVPAKSQLSSTAPQGQSITRLLSMASLIPHGENLTLTVSQANLPVLELNKHGVILSTTLGFAAWNSARVAVTG